MLEALQPFSTGAYKNLLKEAQGPAWGWWGGWLGAHLPGCFEPFQDFAVLLVQLRQLCLVEGPPQKGAQSPALIARILYAPTSTEDLTDSRAGKPGSHPAPWKEDAAGSGQSRIGAAVYVFCHSSASSVEAASSAIHRTGEVLKQWNLLMLYPAPLIPLGMRSNCDYSVWWGLLHLWLDFVRHSLPVAGDMKHLDTHTQKKMKTQTITTRGSFSSIAHGVEAHFPCSPLGGLADQPQQHTATAKAEMASISED